MGRCRCCLFRAARSENIIFLFPHCLFLHGSYKSWGWGHFGEYCIWYFGDITQSLSITLQSIQEDAPATSCGPGMLQVVSSHYLKDLQKETLCWLVLGGSTTDPPASFRTGPPLLAQGGRFLAACGQNVLQWRRGQKADRVGASALQTPSGISGCHPGINPWWWEPRFWYRPPGRSSKRSFPIPTPIKQQFSPRLQTQPALKLA